MILGNNEISVEMDMKPLSEVNETVVTRLTQRLRDEILSGRLPFGARLKLREIADRFGVSNTPVRDALVKLNAEGLVELQPNSGASVRRIDLQFLENLFDIRMALEELLVRRCIARSSDAELATLALLAAKHVEAVHQGDVARVMAANSRFHQRITALARNADAKQILEQSLGLIHALRRQVGYAPGRLQEAANEHAALVAAIERRDIQSAAAIAREHVELSRDDALKRFKL